MLTNTSINNNSNSNNNNEDDDFGDDFQSAPIVPMKNTPMKDDNHKQHLQDSGSNTNNRYYYIYLELLSLDTFLRP